jgi:hypothetical protein
MNMSGFSLGQMRKLCGSKNEEALGQLRERIHTKYHYMDAGRRTPIAEVIERAVMSGVPFPDLQAETHVHSCAAELLALHGQDWLVTDASNYHASALEDGLWRGYGKLASPETKGFLRGLAEGLPMFGRQPPNDGSAYATVSLDRLRAFLPGLRDLAETIAYRVGRKHAANEEERAGAQFATEFCGWVDQIVAAERDLFFEFG